jgi:hypothetical protein
MQAKIINPEFKPAISMGLLPGNASFKMNIPTI